MTALIQLIFGAGARRQPRSHAITSIQINAAKVVAKQVANTFRGSRSHSFHGLATSVWFAFWINVYEVMFEGADK